MENSFSLLSLFTGDLMTVFVSIVLVVFSIMSWMVIVEKIRLWHAQKKNPITIIDLSSVDSYWQKTYIDYIVSDIEQENYLITRINDEHFDVELINKIYNKKKNIKFIPNVSYNYKKLPTVMQHCKNYILSNK